MRRTALQTAAAIRAGQSSALAETEAAIARIEAGDGEINAVVVRDFDRARAAAKALDDRGPDDRPLFGVPMTVKESFDIAGLPSSWGFAEHADHIASADAVTVQRLKAAGAVILGKTNVPVGLADLQSNNPNYGRTRNPHHLKRVCGGSSGGAAAALAAGYVPIELGSDIGGSIRVPAAFCGVWGHKSSFTAIAPEGHYFPRTDNARIAMSVIGPLAADPDDLAAELAVLTDIPLPRPAPRKHGDWRILLLPEHPVAKAQAAIKQAIHGVGDAFEKAGARVDRASDLLPDLAEQYGDYMHMLNIAMTRGAKQESRPLPTLADWFGLLDDQARNVRVWQRLFADYDAVIAPAWGTTAFPHDDTPITERRLDMDGEDTQFGLQLAWPGLATFPMLPATSVPVGTDAEGLPIGVQVIADTNRDFTAIAVAKAAHDLVMR
ncbi:amidase family protein [Hephaestia sp. MAHUQ-44]|uniref:amidase family protein n=1 Tax=Hephaestia sp. MAHUQ-44 TaxID=2952526 RepID=UPI002077201E|nr:amidase family protein [Hephaestia sp. MAHUQ-44]